MKGFVISVAITPVGMSTAAAQDTCYPGANRDLAGAIGSTIDAFIGSSVALGRSQTLATGAGALLGGGIGASLSQPVVRQRLPTLLWSTNYMNTGTRSWTLPSQAKSPCQGRPGRYAVGNRLLTITRRLNRGRSPVNSRPFEPELEELVTALH